MYPVHHFIITDTVTSLFSATRERLSQLGREQDVRPSVSLAVMLVNCDDRVQCTADMLIPHERAITLVS